jgi:hypothetical protein
MAQLALIFQTEPGRGTPRLKPLPGADVPWDDGALRELEEDLSRQYEDLIRGKVASVTFRSRPLRVRVQDGGASRQPTVVLTDDSAEPMSGTGWLSGLLADLERLQAASGDIDHLERSMLRYAVEELTPVATDLGSPGLAGLLLSGHLASAEALARTEDPPRATVYAIARRGLEKLLHGADAIPGHGRVRPLPDGQAPRGGVARLMRRLFAREDASR